MGAFKLLLTLITVYLGIAIFGDLFGLDITFLSTLTNTGGFDTGGISVIFDGIELIIGFVALPLIVATDNDIQGAGSILLGFLGLLNWIVLAYYVRGSGD